MRKSGPGHLSLEVADQTAPRDEKRRGDHYRRHLADAHAVIEAYSRRITDLEVEVSTVRVQAAYDLNLSLSRATAEEARQAAASAMRERAAVLFEDCGAPTEASEAIRALPNPKPKFTK